MQGLIWKEHVLCAYVNSIYIDWQACAYLNWLHHTFNPICGSYTSDWSHVFCHNPSLEGEMNINHSQTRQTSGFLSLSLSGCSEADYSRDMLCWVKSKLVPPVDFLHSFSPLLCSLSVSSLGGRWQVSSRQEQQPFMSSNVVTFRNHRRTVL